MERSHLGYTTWGNVADLMAKVYECHWVPRLRKLTKQVIKSCAGCKRFQAIALRNPPPRPLPVDRSQGSTPLEVIGIDFAGPLRYQISRSKTEGEAYIALYSCSLMRAVYLDVTQSLETSIRSLKQFIARRWTSCEDLLRQRKDLSWYREMAEANNAWWPSARLPSSSKHEVAV